MKNKIVLIILIFISQFSFALEFDFNFTNLWGNSSGNALNYNFELNQNADFKNQNLFLGVNFNLLNSTLDFFQNQSLSAKINFLYQNNFFYANSKITFIRANDLFVKKDKQEFLINDLKSFNINNSIGFKFDNFEIFPFATFFVLQESDGEFYYFNGKIKIPLVKNFGIKFTYYKNLFCFKYHDGNLNIFNTDSEPLGNLFANNFNFCYEYIFSKNDFCLVPQISYNYFSAELIASLTNQNQKFLLFPFVYANIDGDLSAHILDFGLDFKILKKHFNFETNFKTLYFLNQNGKYIFDYLYKKNFMFDGSSGTETSKIDIVNHSGLVVLDLKSNFLFDIQKSSWSINLSKTFLIPLNFSEDLSDNFGDDFFTKENIISYLLSGIKVGIRIIY